MILGSRTDLHVQSVTMTGHIYRQVILEQHVCLFLGAMGAEYLFMDDNARPHRANIVDECLQSTPPSAVNPFRVSFRGEGRLASTSILHRRHREDRTKEPSRLEGLWLRALVTE
ncbi:transposable element Tcb2 transposase [Trichonephila clavipes]|uniref:Transposable element Tcb2 transposase n=1 Tax=Trichonephila clavipes TaxID=2585209 RepID=A0A8X6V863_TRICX|nr:transposable element Tcb2 transposase [Trichonephila clavipes]